MSPAKKSSARRSTSSRTSKKTTKKTAKKTAAKKSSRAAAAKKTGKKSSAGAARKTATKKTAKKTAAKKTAAKKSTRKTTGKKTTTRKATSSGAWSTAPRPATRPRKVRPAHFDAKQLREIREQLERERTDLQSQIAEIDEESFQGTQSDITGEVSLDEDFADAGTATFDRERALSIQNNIRDLIDQITRAIGKIDDGTYGTCERCGQPIDAARLKALPHASLCMDCKRREERTR